MITKGERGGGGTNFKYGINIHNYSIETDGQQDLLYSTYLLLFLCCV